MGNRFAEDVRIIVGIDPNESSLEAAPIKSAILAKRGIGYVNPTTGVATSKSGTAGTTKIPTSIGNGDADTGENQAGQTGTNPNDLQTGVMGTSTGVFDVTDVIDGIASPTKTSDAQVGPSGLEYANDNALNAITAVDCVSGEAVQIRTRNDFSPPEAVAGPEGGENVSDAWEDADTPPDVAGFTLGSYWNIIGAGSPTNEGQGSGVNAAIEAFIVLLDAQSGVSPWTFDKYESNAPLPDYTFTFRRPNTTTATFPGGLVNCISLPPDDAGSCPLEAPKETAWPVDGQYDLKLDAGQFVTHSLDTEVPPEYKNPSSLIPFCFDGGRTGSIEVTKDNGFMVYETSMGAPTGIIRVFDSSGHMIAFTDTTGIGSYRPEPTP